MNVSELWSTYQYLYIMQCASSQIFYLFFFVHANFHGQVFVFAFTDYKHTLYVVSKPAHKYAV